MVGKRNLHSREMLSSHASPHSRNPYKVELTLGSKGNHPKRGAS